MKQHWLGVIALLVGCSSSESTISAPSDTAVDSIVVAETSTTLDSNLDEDPASDVETGVIDTGGETSGDGGLTCSNVQAEFAAYRAAHDSCTTVTDCSAIGGTGTCECAKSLGSESGNGIRTDAVDGAQKYFDVFKGCDAPKVCDAAPGALSCTGGHCMVGLRSCLPSPSDGGPG